MDTSRWSPGQLVAGAGGILLLISLFLPWFGGLRHGASFNGWEIQTMTDVFLLIVAAIAIVNALAPRRASVIAGTTLNAATALLGGVATALLLWLVAFDFPDVFAREIGLYVGLGASAVVALGAYTTAKSQTETSALGGGPVDDVTSATPAQWIVGLGGTLLFISLFVPWLGGGFDGESFDGWVVLLTIDAFFVITAVVAASSALAVRSAVTLPGMSMGGAAGVLGVVATILLVWFLVFDFPEPASREVGPYLSLIAAAAIAVGGVLVAKSRRRDRSSCSELSGTATGFAARVRR